MYGIRLEGTTMRTSLWRTTKRNLAPNSFIRRYAAKNSKTIAGVSPDALAALTHRQPGSTADPTQGDMFGSNSYDGGAVVLHALRLTIGPGGNKRGCRRVDVVSNSTSVRPRCDAGSSEN